MTEITYATRYTGESCVACSTCVIGVTGVNVVTSAVFVIVVPGGRVMTDVTNVFLNVDISRARRHMLSR